MNIEKNTVYVLNADDIGDLIVDYMKSIHGVEINRSSVNFVLDEGELNVVARVAFQTFEINIEI